MELAEGPVWALGLMSGTSMDGVDGAAILTDGHEVQGFGPKRFLEFTDQERALIASGQGKWPGDDPVLTRIADAVLEKHAEMALYFPTVDLVGFHGQTLAHDPTAWRSHQIGDGAALADRCRKPVVWDFRTADVLSGGQGAPLVPFFHHACARLLGFERPVVFLNIGGVANVTWVDPNARRPEGRDALLAFDTGPGNALINDLMQQRMDMAQDDDGATAARGMVDEDLVAEALTDPYFDAPPPKSLDRDHFRWLLERVAPLSTEDAAATLAAVTAASIADASRHMPELPERWIVAGGGRRNATLMAMLSARTNAPVETAETIGLDGDFLEAQAFAFLAVRVARGLPTSSPDTTGCRIPVSGGRISQPGAK